MWRRFLYQNANYKNINVLFNLVTSGRFVEGFRGFIWSSRCFKTEKRWHFLLAVHWNDLHLLLAVRRLRRRAQRRVWARRLQGPRWWPRGLQRGPRRRPGRIRPWKDGLKVRLMDWYFMNPQRGNFRCHQHIKHTRSREQSTGRGREVNICRHTLHTNTDKDHIEQLQFRRAARVQSAASLKRLVAVRRNDLRSQQQSCTQIWSSSFLTNDNDCEFSHWVVFFPQNFFLILLWWCHHREHTHTHTLTHTHTVWSCGRADDVMVVLCLQGWPQTGAERPSLLTHPPRTNCPPPSSKTSVSSCPR